ncbi:MAG: hypothetical protein GC160_29045 [Acidobacteria bacterium]|nr:hypothetical protein [Acidobacteriota bacterium]
MLTRRGFTRTLLAGAGAGFVPIPAQAAGLAGMLWEYTQAYIDILEERRRKTFDAMRTPAELDALRARVRQAVAEAWGPLPETRTPLNARQVGAVERDDYVIEKVIFESRPELFVTANVYRPKQVSGKLPAVVVPCGHSDTGKAAETYQRFCILLARHGFIALIYDPVGQGERLEFFDPATGASRVGPGTKEHRVLGHQSWLVGVNLMGYRVWDAARAIDYLQQRPDVDPDKIGMGGNSGGGMETLQYCAFDERIQAAFPSCAVASFPAKTRALLIADPEQVLPGILRAGVDHVELLAAFAPKPLIIGSAIQDFVPIDAARETFREVQKAYRIAGAEQHVRMIETDAGHGLNEQLRVGAVDWFLRWLSPVSRAVKERPATISTPEELQCTESGQTSVSLNGKTVVDLNCERARHIAPQRETPSAGNFPNYRVEIQHAIQRVARVGVHKPEQGIFVADRALEPHAYPRGTVIVIADLGKDDVEVRRSVIDPILSAGYEALGLDLRGWGESRPESVVKVGFDWQDFFAYRSLEIGRPLLGQRIKDVVALTPNRTRHRSWSIVGVGPNASLVAAHAAVLDARIDRLISIGPPLSFESLVLEPVNRQPFSSYLPGVIAEYEVRDLLAACAPRPTLVLNPENPQGEAVPESRAWEQFDWAAQVYEAIEAPGKLEVRSELDAIAMRSVIAEWLGG